MKEVHRSEYIGKIAGFGDRPEIIKVIIGPRRSGKSIILDQYRRHLLESGVAEDRILYINFESSEYDGIRDHRDLNGYISERMPHDRRIYVLMDEIQRVEMWERTVNSLSADYDADVYVTGSNAYLLSSELSTYLSGRYVEIEVLPFSFKEFLQSNPADADNDRTSRFQQYLRIGGIPITDAKADEATNDIILEGVFHTVLLKDVAQRAKIGDTATLEAVARFLFDNTKNLTNVENISSVLKINTKTVKKYICALREAFLVFKAERYDIAGKKMLKTHEKYYPADVGLARVALDRGLMEPSAALETVVYLELKRRGYRIRVGSFRDREVDFTAEKDGRLHYYQVCLTVMQDDTFGREVGSLESIRDSYPKTILSLDTVLRPAPNGIVHRNVIDWLLERFRRVSDGTVCRFVNIGCDGDRFLLRPGPSANQDFNYDGRMGKVCWTSCADLSADGFANTGKARAVSAPPRS